MRKLMQKLWQDDAGIVALEYLLVATIVGLGLVVGLAAVEGALDSELTELANAITVLDQSYSFVSIHLTSGAGELAFKSGTNAVDTCHTFRINTDRPNTCFIDVINLP